MSALPREILKWIQGLDLSYPVKNVKRDFSNGFLVAEIFSRYYSADVTMHSFDNGTSTKKKIENWILLEKFFKKMKMPIERSLMDGVIYCKEGAAVDLLAQVYTILTNKTAQVVQVEEKEHIPAFARPTVNVLIGQRMKDPEVLLNDHWNQVANAEQIVQQHNELVRAERSNDPVRLAAARSPQNLRVAPRQIGRREAAVPQVQFQEVKVKQLDQSAAQLKAQRVASQTGQPQGSASGQGPQFSPSQTAQPAASPTQTGHTRTLSLPAKSNMEIFNAVVMSRMEGREETNSWDPRKDAAVSFTDACFSASSPPASSPNFSGSGPALSSSLRPLPDALVSAVLTELLHSHSDALAQNALHTPKDFYTLFGLLWGVVHRLPSNSQGFAAALTTLVELGQKLVVLDGYVAGQLFIDYAAVKIAHTLRTQHEKAGAAARVMYAHYAASGAEHLKPLTHFKECLDPAMFLVLLIEAVQLERDLANAQLLEFYFAHAHDASATTSTLQRALSSILWSHLCANPQAHAHPQTDLLAAQHWDAAIRGKLTWALQVGVAVFSCAELCTMTPSDPRTEQVESIIRRLLVPSSHTAVLVAGLASLSRALRLHHQLHALFIALLIDRPDVRTSVLNGTAVKPLRESKRSTPRTEEDGQGQQETENAEEREQDPEVTSLAQLHAPRLQDVWHPLSVAQAVVTHVQEQKLDNLSSAHVELLAAVIDALPIFGAVEEQAWAEIFEALSVHLVVELYDPLMCEDVSRILLRFLISPATQPVAMQIMAFQPNQKSAPQLWGIMKSIFEDGTTKARENLCHFLSQLASLPNGPFAVHVARLIKTFEKFEPNKYAGSGLQPVLKTILAANPTLQLGA